MKENDAENLIIISQTRAGSDVDISLNTNSSLKDSPLKKSITLLNLFSFGSKLLHKEFLHSLYCLSHSTTV